MYVILNENEKDVTCIFMCVTGIQRVLHNYSIM